MFATSFNATALMLKDSNDIVVVGFEDQLVERFGYRPGDDYTTDYWLPLMGPSTFTVGCRMAAGLSKVNEYPVTIAAVAESVGLRANKGLALVKRSMARLVGLELVTVQQSHSGLVLSVRRAWAPLTARQVLWLPSWLAEQHRQEHGQDPTAGNTAGVCVGVVPDRAGDRKHGE